MSLVIRSWVLLFFCSLGAFAENDVRLWVTRNGDALEGVLVRREINDIVIRDTDGVLKKTKFTMLSEEDQAYIVKQNPPDASASNRSGRKIDIRQAFGNQLVYRDGRVVSTDILDLKVVLVFFAKRDCRNCYSEYMSIQTNLFEQLGEKADLIQPVFASMDPNRKDMIDAMDEWKMDWPAFPFEGKERKDLARRVKLIGVPEGRLFKPNGELLSARVSYLLDGDTEDFEEWLELFEENIEDNILGLVNQAASSTSTQNDSSQ